MTTETTTGVSIHVDNTEAVAEFRCLPTTSAGGTVTEGHVVRLSFHDENGASMSIAGTPEDFTRWLAVLQSGLEYTLMEAQ